VVVVIPWLYVILSRWLDRRWLGRRYTPQEALSHFMGALRSATTQPELLAKAQDGLKEIFGAAARVSLDPPPDREPSSAGAHTQTIAIRSGDRDVGHIQMGPRVDDTPYFSEDVHLLGSLAGIFAHVLENLQLQQRRLEVEQRARELSLHASRSELKALRAQINPHFLFNALNAISSLVLERRNEEAEAMLLNLSAFLHSALAADHEGTIGLDDEIGLQRRYLDIEEARFAERMRVDIDVPQALGHVRVPTLILQPLVENAVRHGVDRSEGTTTIRIAAARQGARLRIVVEDDGAGEGPERRGGGLGLVNVRERLEAHFGPDGRLTAGPRPPGGFRAEIELPLEVAA
jgi:K+-sensing histidine kinase KdpD